MKLRLALPFVLAALVAAGCSSAPRSADAPRAAAPEFKTNFSALPETVTSFGAVTLDNWLYVFGGHKGERHEYSAEKVSGSFHRLRLDDGRAWEPLPASAPGQGLPLVAHAGHVYRLGGMAARNPAGVKQDLFSTALTQRFNPRRGSWEDFAPLPAPRSSHDAVVVGDKLYIAGGWSLAGGTNRPAWPDNALVLDLSRPSDGWREFPQPFRRRALALAAVGSRIFCIGGMDSNNETTLAVDIYDTATAQWSKGPELPTGKHKGFSCSAIAQGGRVYASAFKGDLLRLSADEQSWEIIGRLQHPRMAHRLVTAGSQFLIALGGEDGEDKRPDLELLNPSAKPAIKVAAQSSPAEATTAHAR